MGELKKVLKHDHSLTDILKVCIFAIVMMAPFFAVLFECLYMVCNKNAPSNYTGVQQDVFYNALTNITTKTVFTWTTSTAMFSTISAVLTGLEFGSNNILAILLTYWILNTLIYVLFDIIIDMFVKLTHFLRN